MPKYWVIIPAAGIGRRMQSGIPKQYLSLLGKPVLEHTIASLLSYPLIQKIVVVVAANDTNWPNLQQKLPQQRILTAFGGKERYHSVYHGLKLLKNIAADNDWVLVHDAVRPCLKHAELDRLIQALANHPTGGLLGVKVQDTLKVVDAQGLIQHTLERSNVWRAQTPQMFRMNKLHHALEKAMQEGHEITDDASALQLLGEQLLMVEGSIRNIKITEPEDLLLAENLLTVQSS